MDYSIGFLHEINQSRTPLVYDIQELFRWLIDVSVIQLLEEKKIRESDFIITENYHTRLRENTAKMLIEKINHNFNHKELYKNHKRYSYQNILHDQTQQLANFILDKQKQFGPAIDILEQDGVELLVSGPKASASMPMPDGTKPLPGGWNRFQMSVDDLESFVSKLKEKGIQFKNEIIEGPGGKQILCIDPSGNVIELFQPA